MNPDFPKTREDALRNEEKAYFTGEPCQNGHIDKRYAKTGVCYGCKREQNKRDRKEHPENLRQQLKRSYERHKEDRLEQSKEWALQNRDKSREIKSNWKKKNRDKYLKQSRAYMRKKRENPEFRLSRNISKGVWESLKEVGKKKNGRKWESIVGYTSDELVLHLESQFLDGMAWENYGHVWHIDHIVPLSWFGHDRILNAWALENLQPMFASENCSKCNRYAG